MQLSTGRARWLERAPDEALPEAELGPSSLERAVRELVEAESSREMSVEGVLGVD